MEQTDVKKRGGAVARRYEEGEDDAREEAGKIYGVGEDADAQVGDGQDDDEADEEEPLEGFDGESEAEVAADEEQASREFDERVHRRNGKRAGAAFSAQPEPAQNGNVVVRLDRRFAAGATRRRRNDGKALRDA